MQQRQIKGQYHDRACAVGLQKNAVDEKICALQCEIFVALGDVKRDSVEVILKMAKIMPELFAIPKVIWDKWPELVRQDWTMGFVGLTLKRKKQFITEWKRDSTFPGRILQAYPIQTQSGRATLFEHFPHGFIQML